MRFARHRGEAEGRRGGPGNVARPTISWIATPPWPVERPASFDTLWRLAMTA
jgi:hypothetical protein